MLPMGMRVSPYYMQMWLNQIVQLIRTEGVFSWGHIDDILVMGTERQLRRVIDTVLPALEAVGVHFARNKSVLTPTKQLVFCGAT